MKSRLLPMASALLLASVVPLAVATAASAAPVPSAEISPRVTTVREAAGKSPFAGKTCNMQTIYGYSPGGKVAESYIAVNPTDPNNRIVTYMDATTATIDTAYTTDSGQSWHVVVPQGIDNCTGNNTAQWEASDSDWVSFGPDGVAYLSTLSWAHFVTPPFDQYASVVNVLTSRDGGRTWSPPALVSGPGAVGDAPMVLADPRHPGVAYDIWANQAFGKPVGVRGNTALMFTKTTDHGHHWSTPTAIATAGLSDDFGDAHLSVLDNGTLVVTSGLGNADGTSNEMSWRSTDGGQTWQKPTLVRVATAGSTPEMCGWGTYGSGSSSGSGPQQVLDGHSVLLLTNDGTAESAGEAKLILSRSDDGGLTWHSSTVYHSSQPIILASMAVNHQQIGLEFDQIDTQNINCNTGTVPARSQFAVASVHHDGKVTFGKPVTLGAAWWNLNSALREGAVGGGDGFDYYLGEYQALAAVPGGGFTTSTAQGQPLAPGGPTLTGGLNGVIVANVSTDRDR